MIRVLVACAWLVVAPLALAFQPHTGQWWNPSESGSGYNIDVQNGVLVVTIFSYKGNGDSEWYLAAAALTNTGHNFTATLDKYRNGQCISCAYAGRPGLAGNDGAISISFSSETSATLTLPGGRTTAIVPYNFGYGDPPSGLLGEWVFFYDIVTTFAERFNYTSVGNKTSTGNGVVIDSGRNATCEYQTSGSFVGLVLCFDFDSTLTVTQNIYRFRYGIDETYGGIYTYPPSGNNYSMKGLRTAGSSGATRAAVADDALSSRKAVEDVAIARAKALPVMDAELAAAADEARAALLRARQD
ncbi:MAG: hypothetical protein U1F10_07565 [Burkholderiales bacterium]